MGRLLSGLLLLNLLVACGEKLPEGVLPEGKMPALLVDVHLMDSELASRPIDSARALFYSSYDAVFKRHGIDSATFNRSIQYYSSRPIVFKEIYDRVGERLQAYITEDEAIRAEQYRQQMAADSLAAIRRRDSLYWLDRDSAEFKRLRHLLLLRESDSTLDAAEPYTFQGYSIRLFDELALWKLRFETGSGLLPDSADLQMTPLPSEPRRPEQDPDPLMRVIQQ